MKKNYLFVALLFAALATQAQATLTIKGAVTGIPTLYVKNGASIYVRGGVTIDQAGSPGGAANDYLQNNGTLTIASDSAVGQSNFTNNVNGLTTYTTGQTTGEVIFGADDETQAITGSGNTRFMKLSTPAPVSPTLNLQQDVTVENTLTLGGTTNAIIGSTSLTLNGTLAGTGTFAGSTTSRLFINGSGNLGSALTFTSGATVLQKFFVNRTNVSGHTVLLGSELTVYDTLGIQNGIVNVQANPLALVSTGLAGAPFSVNNMIQADGAGYFKRITLQGPGSYIYPVGDGTPAYSPATIEFVTNPNPNPIAVNVKNTAHPQINNPNAATSYIKRYWSLISNIITPYTYNLTLQYLPADIVGTEAAIKTSRWDNSWFTHTSSTAAANVLTTTAALNETDAPLTGDFTGRNVACAAVGGTITAAKDSVCEGSSQDLLLGGSNGAVQWQSSLTGTNFADINNATGATYQAPGTQTTYYRAYSTAGGCSDTTGAFKLNVKTLPAAPVATITDPIICSGDSTQVCANAGFTTYRWNNGATTQCIYAKAAGGYWVTGTGSNGCESAASERESLSIYQPLPVSAIVQGDTLTAFGGTAYQWYLNGQPIQGATASVYVAQQTGNYSVEVTDNNGCKNRSTDIPVTVTGIHEMEMGSEVVVYPNPVKDELVIYMKNGRTINQVRIIDMLGREVLNRPMINGGYSLVKMDVSQLPAGVFQLMLYSNGQYLGSKAMIHQSARD